MCVCERESLFVCVRESLFENMSVCVCVSVCVCGREREKARKNLAMCIEAAHSGAKKNRKRE